MRVVTKDASNPIYKQCVGIDRNDARRIVQSTRSNVPEPIRVAHLIATGVICKKSRGKA